MKYSFYFMLLAAYFLTSCLDNAKESIEVTEVEKQIEFLPFNTISLNDMTAFKPVSENWQVVDNVVADRIKEKTFYSKAGSGILLNTPKKGANENLFFNFEHGDIELEVDVMMPVKSNSGLYFQGRYEIQLLDSWTIKNPKHSDIGGIYQRWDESREEGKKGYEGHPPLVNTAKAPGLWQRFKIKFHAPKFDQSGKKIKNASFEEVWLNGVLIQKDIEVTGPTRAAAFQDEKPKGALMIQGDHGPVAFKNIKYKLYGDKKLSFNNLILKEYETDGSKKIPNLDALQLASEIKTDSINLLKIASKKIRKVMTYSGSFEIPETGDYLFEMKLNGGGLLIINNDTIINMDGDYNLNKSMFSNIFLNAGSNQIDLIYNKHTPWKRGFNLYVEGPKIQKYSIQEPAKLLDSGDRNMREILIEPKSVPVTQRSFVMHKGLKRTHCISVGSPQGIHYSYDLTTSALLNLWYGSFMNAADMWHSRGEHQLGEPRGFSISSHGNVEFVLLKNKKTNWPKNENLKQLGYEFNSQEIPVFSHKLGNTIITNTFFPSDDERSLKRVITTNGDKTIWHKIAEGENIEALKNGLYIVNNESYYIDFSGHEGLKPLVRKINNRAELIVKIPSGEQRFNYSIIW